MYSIKPDSIFSSYTISLLKDKDFGSGGGSSGGLVTQSLIPANNSVDLGSTGSPFRSLYVSSNTIYVGGAAISSTNNTISLPSGSTIGGVNPGTITILGSFSHPSQLPTTGVNVGDGYIISPDLWVAVSTQQGEGQWVDVGPVQGPQGANGTNGTNGSNGPQGPQGPASGGGGGSGPQGPQGTNGPQGANGTNGTNGTNGNVGPQGPAGGGGGGGVPPGTNYANYLYWDGSTYASGGAQIKLGRSAGQINQGSNAVAMGFFTGYTDQGTEATAVGAGAGQNQQGQYSTAIGRLAGNSTQGFGAVAVGYQAGQNNQGTNSIAIGNVAGFSGQPANTIIMNATGFQNNGTTENAFYVQPVRQATQTTVLGYDASSGEISYYTASGGGGGGGVPSGSNFGDYLYWDGATYVSGDANVVMGGFAGQYSQGLNSIAIGCNAGNYVQENNAVAIGVYAGANTQGAYSVAIGNEAGQQVQGNSSVAIGGSAGGLTQGSHSVAIGAQAAFLSQRDYAVAIGNEAGRNNQGDNSTALGNQAGNQSQGIEAVAVGDQAGLVLQGDFAVAVGAYAGRMGQGAHAIAIGTNAGSTGQPASSIILNATGNALNPATANAFYVKPIRSAAGPNSLSYDSTSGEITYSAGGGGPQGPAGQDGPAGPQGPSGGGGGGVPSGTSYGSYLYWDGSTYASGDSKVVMGTNAGLTNQGNNSVAIGSNSGQENQGGDSIAIGTQAAIQNQSNNSIAIGAQAGSYFQGANSIAIGDQAGRYYQPSRSIILNATSQNFSPGNPDAFYVKPIRSASGPRVLNYDENSGEITYSSGGGGGGGVPSGTSYGDYLYWDGSTYASGDSKVVMGTNAGQNNQGDNSIAIGYNAGTNNQAQRTIQTQVYGDYFQYIPFQNIQPDYVQIAFYNDTSYFAKSFKLLASNDGSTWTEILSKFISYPGDVVGAQSGYNTYPISLTTSYQYFRVVVEQAQATYPCLLYVNAFNLVVGGSITYDGLISGGVGYPGTDSPGGSWSTSFDGQPADLSGNDPQYPPVNPLNNTLTSYSYNYNGPNYGSYSGAVYTNVSIPGPAKSIAIGYQAAQTNQGYESIAFGQSAAQNGQGNDCIAIGSNAGVNFQCDMSIAIGQSCGQNNQGNYCLAIGSSAGQNNQGNYSIAIGNQAGFQYQAANSIILNASGSTLNSSIPDPAFYVAPVRADITQTKVLGYDPNTKEVTYFDTPGGGGGGGGVPPGSSYGDYLYWDGSTYAVGDGTINLGQDAGRFSQSYAAVAMGIRAGYLNQGYDSVAIGDSAGQQYQQNFAVAIGPYAGSQDQSSSTVAVGYQAGSNYQQNNAVSIGSQAGYNNQGAYSIAIGNQAGFQDQAARSIILNASGSTLNSSIPDPAFYVAPVRADITQAKVLGYDPDTKEVTYFDTPGGGGGGVPPGSSYGNYLYWDSNANAYAVGSQNIVLGVNAGANGQGFSAVAIGYYAGNSNQLDYSIAIGYNAGSNNQSQESIAIGDRAGESYQGQDSIAIGDRCGRFSQGAFSIAIGAYAGQQLQGSSCIAIGYNAGNDQQSSDSVAIGNNAGQGSQGTYAVAIGYSCGQSNQGTAAIAIGYQAGQGNQSTSAIAIGYQAGSNGQKSNSIAIGYQAGQINQGANTIAIGSNACTYNQPDNTICINGSNQPLYIPSGGENSCFMSPIRDGTNTISQSQLSGLLRYDISTHEITSYQIYQGNPVSNSNLLGYDPATKGITYIPKTFVIQHPDEADKYLVHACLEGPEAGVYYRGESVIGDGEKKVSITLPAYVKNLATDLTVHLTPVMNDEDIEDETPLNIRSTRVRDNSFTVYANKPVAFHWMVFGKRGDVKAEVDKSEAVLRGDGPYKWLDTQ